MNASPPWKISVVVPARNEERLIGDCLRSISEARKLLAGEAPAELIVVCDCCDDSTASEAMDYLGPHDAIVLSDAGLVGEARRLGVAHALSIWGTPIPDNVWIASTDADCIVPPNWLTAQLSLARQGFDAFAGTIEVDDFSEHDPRVRERFRQAYHLHADGSHGHIHGANLGFTAQVYRAAGGWQALATGEDHDLWHRLREAGARATTSSGLPVVTSGRRCGRAPAGFAQALAAHGENAA